VSNLGRASHLKLVVWDGRLDPWDECLKLFKLVFMFFDEKEDRTPFIDVLMHVMFHDVHPMIYFD
ncbi:unnamed protein product, partial [Sphenostylis stenocarpa]